MSFLDGEAVSKLRSGLTSDEKALRRIYRVRKNPYHTQSVRHELAEELKDDGWEESGRSKYKTKLRKLKTIGEFFEDEVWCQLYDLGFRTLNVDENFHLPYGRADGETQQIDVIAVNDETVVLVECKSREERGRYQGFKQFSESLKPKINGYRKALREALGGEPRRLKHITATRNIQISRDGIDAQRIAETGSFLYTDATFKYISGLIKSYKDAAFYQFNAILFPGDEISKERIEVPAIKGSMGGETYYMFSIEPRTLLKLGFVLHRTQANEAELPTYQRLLVPYRLRGIAKFLSNGGYFPNSLLVNFSERAKKLEFTPTGRSTGSNSQAGVLKIPNAFAIAYIIDGQHRLYGYAHTDYSETNTVPVVAFVNLEPTQQLKLFMDINENQKAVSPTLRITLEEDLYWESKRLDSKMKALRSSVVRKLATDEDSPLNGLVAIGEDKGQLSSKPIAKALSKSVLIPSAYQTKFHDGSVGVSLYNGNETDYHRAMSKARDRLYSFLALAFELAKDTLTDASSDFVFSNRGTYPYIMLLSSLNEYLTNKGTVKPTTDSDERFEAFLPILQSLLSKLNELDDNQQSRLLGKLGQGAETLWLRTFQDLVSKSVEDYHPEELQDWLERQDAALQDEARRLGTEIERHLKNEIIEQLKSLYGDDWELEIAAIKRDCDKRVSEQQEKDYKEGLEKKDIHWTEQFFISDYKTILAKYWTKDGEGIVPFQESFAIDLGVGGFNSKSEKLKWLSMFNSWRNSWAHAGTKDKGLNRDEVNMVRKIHSHLLSDT